jgi:hypothetical protein
MMQIHRRITDLIRTNPFYPRAIRNLYKKGLSFFKTAH